MKKFFFFLILFGTMTPALGQFKIGAGVSKTFMDMRSNFGRDYGVSIDGYYQFLDSTRMFELETGIGFSYQWYSKMDYYSNTYLLDDPSYTADYNPEYLHKTRSFEMNIPVMTSYKIEFKKFALVPSIGVNIKWFLSSQSSVFHNGNLLAEGIGLRTQSFLEKVKFNDLISIGLRFNSFELRILADGMILSGLRKNSIYYYYTDKELSVSNVSIKLIYTL